MGIKQLHNSDPSMIGCLWVECSMNGWRPITRMCSFSQKVIPRIPQLAAKSCKCTQRKKSYDPPPLPLNSRGSRASQQRNCGLSELSFSAICLLFSWCLVQTSLTWQGVLTYYLPTHLYQLIQVCHTHDQYLRIQPLVFFILFIHLKVHLWFGDGHGATNGCSWSNQLTGGGQSYRTCQTTKTMRTTVCSVQLSFYWYYIHPN